MIGLNFSRRIFVSSVNCNQLDQQTVWIIWKIPGPNRTSNEVWYYNLNVSTPWMTNTQNRSIYDCSFSPGKKNEHPVFIFCEAVCLSTKSYPALPPTSPLPQSPLQTHKKGTRHETTAKARLTLSWKAQLGQTLLGLHCLRRSQLSIEPVTRWSLWLSGSY